MADVSNPRVALVIFINRCVNMDELQKMLFVVCCLLLYVFVVINCCFFVVGCCLLASQNGQIVHLATLPTGLVSQVLFCFSRCFGFGFAGVPLFLLWTLPEEARGIEVRNVQLTFNIKS